MKRNWNTRSEKEEEEEERKGTNWRERKEGRKRGGEKRVTWSEERRM